MKTILIIVLTTIVVTFAMSQPMKIMTMDSPIALIHVRIMVKAGSVCDPSGFEGLSNLTANLILEGGFGNPSDPVTKEMLAEIVRPWGSRAMPSVIVEKEVVTFSFTVPREVFGEFCGRVLRPMFEQPVFSQAELVRVSKETQAYITSTMQLENIEQCGLNALDAFIHSGTPHGHLAVGTVKGLEKCQQFDVQRFFKTFYTPANIAVAIGSKSKPIVDLVKNSLGAIGKSIKAQTFSKPQLLPPPVVADRSMLIVTQPSTIASGIHAGFPITLLRGEKDYWALYVANVFLGTHRDGFGQLYEKFRQTRGYNYGDYSYMEWFRNRPNAMFPPPNAPRTFQYFNIWLRPVGHEYVHHLTKALTYELENLIAKGMTDDECERAKNKAKVIYLNLAETADRLIAYKLDDNFYGMKEGYLDQYLQAIDKLTPKEINDAIKKYLQVTGLKYVIVTSEEMALKLKNDIATDQNSKGKDISGTNADANQDKAWSEYKLNIPAEKILIKKSTELFEEGRDIK
jgi:zinc protease